MSTIPWQQVRGAHIDPSAIKFTNLQNKQNLFENELFKPPTGKLKIISVDTHDRLAYNDNYFFGKIKYANSQYFMPFEPDGKYLNLHCRFNHLSRNIKDYSMAVNLEDYPVILGNIIRPSGDPILCRGPDDGIKGGTIVSRINTRESIDYFTVLNPDSLNIGVNSITEEFSMFFRFMLEGDPVQHSGVDPTLWYHADNPSGTFGTILRVGTDRQLKFFVKDSGSQFNFISPDGIITSNVWHDACLTYKRTGNVLTMTVDNIPQSDSDNETPTFDGGNNNIFWGVSPENFGTVLKGRFVGRFADARWYKDLRFIRDHETNIWNNRRSICAVNALSFDGVNDNVNCGDDALFKNFTKLSYSMWFKANSTDTGTTKYLLTHGNYYDLYFVDFDDGLYADFFVDADITTTTGGMGLRDDKWHFALVVIDTTIGTNNIKLFVDGILVGQDTGQQGKTYTASGNLKLGESSNGLKGIIRDFRLWKGTALTQTQGLAVRDRLPSAPLPDYWLKLGEGFGSPIDSITRTKLGTVNGATWIMDSNPHPIELGKLDVMGYSRFNDQEYTAGFDSVGYDSTGFDTS